VDGGVVGAAEQDQAGESGRSAIGPVHQVVGVGPARWPVAGRETATAIPQHQGAADGGWHNPGGAADVEGFTGAAEYGGD
jgi:hypothetical protein